MRTYLNFISKFNKVCSLTQFYASLNIDAKTIDEADCDSKKIAKNISTKAAENTFMNFFTK